MSAHSPMSFSEPLSPKDLDKLLGDLALKAFSLHAASAWGSPEGYAINMAIAAADQAIEERNQREQLLVLLSDPKFSQRVKLRNYHAPGESRANKWSAFIWTTDTWEPGADQESFTLNDVPVIADVWAKYGYAGLLAWAGVRRNEEPGSFFYHATDEVRDAYSEAWHYLKLNAALQPAVRRVRIA